MIINLLILGCIMAAQTAIGFTSLVAPSTAEFPRNSEGSIVELKDGRLLLAWTRFYGGSGDASSAHIAAMTSRNGGITWSKPYIIQENTGKQNVMSVSLLRLKSGKIGMFYLEKNGPADLRVYARYSSDEGKSWDPPMRVTKQPGYHVMNNDRVVQLSNGRIICPIAFGPDIRTPESAVSFCLYSDDEGKTWRRSTPDLRAPKRGAMEPGVVELANGDLLMILRTQVGTIYESTSSDHGATWSEAEPSSVRAPEAPSTIKRIPGTDDLLLVWNNKFEDGEGHGGARTPLTAAVSKDSGKTWVNVKNIESDPTHTYAYTSIAFVKRRVILTYYDTPGHWDALSLRFRSIPLTWFYREEN